MREKTINLELIKKLINNDLSKLEITAFEKSFEEGVCESDIAKCYIIWNSCVRIASIINNIKDIDKIKVYKHKDGKYIDPIEIPQGAKDIFLLFENPKSFFTPFGFKDNFATFCKVFKKQPMSKRTINEYIIRGYLRYSHIEEKQIEEEQINFDL